MEQFGDVFISDGKVDVPLKSACFSNLDWTWYNQVGEVHQDLKTYGEKLVSIGIKIENKNQHGQLEPYHCKIQLPYLLKDLPRGPTKEYFDFAKDSEIATAKELGIFDLYAKSDITKFLKFAGLTAFVCPNEGLVRQSRLQTYLRIITVVDDAMDEGKRDDDSELGKVSNILRTLKFASMVPFSREGKAILRGNSPSDLETLVTMKEAASLLASGDLGLKDISTIRQYYNIGNGIIEGIRSECLRLAGASQDFDEVLDSFEAASEAGQLEICREWRCDKDHEMFREVQQDIRLYTIGLEVWVEAVALQLGIKLAPEIRSNFILKWVRRDAATFLAKMNDIMSYANEWDNPEAAVLNEVFLLHTQDGLKLQEAFQKVNADANRCASRIMQCEQMLLEFFGVNEQLLGYLDIVKKVMYGVFQASCFLDRYHSGLKVDCFVHN